MNDSTTSIGRHRFSVDEYQRMIAANIFQPDAQLELLDGEIIETSGSPSLSHAAAIASINARILAAATGWALVRSRKPITLGEFSQTTPDFAIVALGYDAIATRHPIASEASLIIEVADSSQSFELNRKIPIYAVAGIAESWFVDLVERTVHVFRDTNGFDYQEHLTFGADDVVTTSAVPHLHFNLGEVCANLAPSA